MSKPKLAMRWRDGGLVPADTFTREFARHWADGDLLWVVTHKPRSPKFHRAIHKLFGLLIQNSEQFAGASEHAALKRVQLEAEVECDYIAYQVKGYGQVMQRIPRSIDFSNMDEDEFRAVASALCDHVASEYWPEFGLHLLKERDAA